mmetsp:Transcript_9871/g.16167  ORF Transcript_9871/g.16167 Transcript_9871/m.16167 type:complete len:100 (+) Transcript_9871:517-816(+)
MDIFTGTNFTWVTYSGSMMNQLDESENPDLNLQAGTVWSVTHRLSKGCMSAKTNNTDTCGAASVLPADLSANGYPLEFLFADMLGMPTSYYSWTESAAE